MMQDMDDMDASCIFDVTVGMFHQLERSTVYILTVTYIGIVMLTVQHDMIFCPNFT